MQIVPFAEADSEKLRELASVHIQSIPYSINARLGEDHIYELYNLFKENKDIFGFVAIENNQAIGLILAARSYGASTALVRSVQRRLLKRFLTISFLAKNTMNVIDFLTLKVKITKDFSKISYLMLWYVNKEWSRQGIGKLLLCKLCNELYNQNQKAIVVDVRKTSSRAISVYFESGFKLVSGTPQSHILLKPLKC